MNNEVVGTSETYVPARMLPRAEPRKSTPIKLLSRTVLWGCNVHHASTVIRQTVDLGAFAGMSHKAAGPDFAQLFLDRFFDMRQMMRGSRMSADFIERLRSPGGVPFEQVLLEAVLAVDTAMAFARRNFVPIGFSAVVPTESRSKVQLVWETKAPRISRRAATVALAGCLELLPIELRSQEHAESFAALFAALEKRARRGEVSTTTAVLALAASNRGLPCEVMRGPHLRLGDGAAQRLIYASVTDHTSLVASQLARNKHRTNLRLADLHLPVARQIPVDTTAEALAAANAIGYPVVMKPLKEKQATGVTVGIAGPEAVATAFARAKHANQRADQRVVVEQFVRGRVHRLLVVGRRFVAALETTPPTVTGDGSRTIAELVDELNRDPLRNEVWLFKIPVDEDLERDLALAGYKLDDVLGKDETVCVRSAANAAIGGIHTDITDRVHPDNQEMAVRAADAIGLDIAGIDFVTEDISRSYREAGGAIIEVNARPGLCMHTWPRFGESRPVAAAVLASMFPRRATGRIPAAMIIGNRGTARVGRELDAILHASGKCVALATRKRHFVNGEPVTRDVARNQNPLLGLLRDKRVQTLVSCMSPRRAVERGLGLDVCEVAAITDRDTKRGAQNSLDQALQALVKSTRGVLVINAKNRAAREALRDLDPKRLILIGSSSRDPGLVAHAAAGGAIIVRSRKQRQNEQIVLRREGKVIVSTRVARAAGSTPRAARRDVESRMFAIALAFGLGLTSKQIKAALRPKRDLSAA